MTNANASMSGKICLVTGATAGIGVVTAQALAQRGATVIIVGRSAEKSAATVEQIKRQTGSATVEAMLADLSSQQEIRRLAQQFQSRFKRLDVLVNNAGGLFMSRQQSADGIEMTFALNHLSYFLLTNLLLDTLKASAPSRIVNVASDAHESAKLDFDDLQGQRRYSGIQAYGRSKLANILFTYELARRLEGSGVTVNTLHPGVVATNFGANNGRLSRVVRRLADFVSISPEQGAQTSIYLATSPDVERVTGQYFVKQKATRSSNVSYDTAAAARLWQVSEELTGLTVAV